MRMKFLAVGLLSALAALAVPAQTTVAPLCSQKSAVCYMTPAFGVQFPNPAAVIHHHEENSPYIGDSYRESSGANRLLIVTFETTNDGFNPDELTTFLETTAKGAQLTINHLEDPYKCDEAQSATDDGPQSCMRFEGTENTVQSPSPFVGIMVLRDHSHALIAVIVTDTQTATQKDVQAQHDFINSLYVWPVPNL